VEESAEEDGDDEVDDDDDDEVDDDEADELIVVLASGVAHGVDNSPQNIKSKASFVRDL